MAKNTHGRRESNARSPTTREGFALELSTMIESALVSQAGDNLSPQQLTEILVVAIFESLGGRVVYIPRGYKIARERRNQEIFADWQTGLSIKELSRKYSLVSPTVYGVIASLKAMTTTSEQTPATRMIDRLKLEPKLIASE